MGNGVSIHSGTETCLALKESGNVAFKSGLYPEAIYYYSQAINLLLQENFKEEEELISSLNDKGPENNKDNSDPENIEQTRNENKELLSILYSNRSACFLEGFHNTESSLQDAQRCIALRSTWSKAYFRAGKASLVAGDYHLSVQFFEKSLALE